MADIKTNDIRNIALVGHNGSGKTSFGETILFNTGFTTRLNKVDEKNSVLDYTDEEVARGITIGLKLATVKWLDKTINFIDTPGFVDFFGEVISSSKVVESLIFVIDGSTGVDLGTENAWELRKKEKLAGLFLINKMKKENVDYEKVFQEIKNTFSESATLIELPIGVGPNFKGVVDLITGKAYTYENGKRNEVDVPSDIKDLVEKMKKELLEQIASSDESLMEKFFADELSQEDINTGFLNAIKSGNLYPVCFADSVENIGCDIVLDYIVKYLPSPADLNTRRPIESETYPEKPDQNSPFAGFVFKTNVEKHLGDINFVRVFSGTLKSGNEIYNSSKNVTEKVNQMYINIGKERKEIDELTTGMIGVLVKLKSTKTSDTICDKSINIKFPPIEFPHANVSMAIIPLAKGDEEKISNGLSKLHEEDPSFYFKFDPEIKQTLIHGLGTIHLEVIINKLKEKFGVNVNLEKPRIKYRETIKKSASAEGKHKKQSGGRGQFGVCNVKFEPLPRGSGFVFQDEIFGGAIPSKFVPSVEKGIKDALEKGVVAGYPIVDVKATLFDGKYHDVDSSDIAFQIAGSLAVKGAIPLAAPVILEPIMNVEVTVPEEYMGDIMGDINARRGKILGTEHAGRYQKIKALVPEAEMYQYSSQLRSMTQGRGTFKMEFETYEEVPKEKVAKIIEEAKRFMEEQQEK
ncbi:MAG: elongation factor G [bacterium]|uniref:Elongation factor G n=1 Tax=candidate division TA06 bacterium 34_109 TaxID=1635277 RepID=A0A101I142_UNCT6|nr:MAG: Translation elongation factor G [candidate division TA06 bacterium 32_111]KUK87092.1 MAG: Translation elongation factor G [candidate division TA06 bacterium 34_109]MDI6699687.1 elongation factor G [bacterium]